MKKKIMILGACSMLLCGCGKIPKLQNGEEAIVTFKDGQMISVNDFYEEIKNSFGLQTLVNMVNKYVYESELPTQKDSANAYADAYISQMKDNYDSEAQLLQIIQSYYGYQTIEAYRDSLYINYLQNQAINNYIKENITDKELEEYYKTDVFPDMTISHILITPDVTENMSTEKKTEAENKAKDTINEIIEKLNQAKKDGKDIKEEFASLAKEYSEDESTKDKGGNLESINIGSLNSKYDELVKAAANLKDNEYSTKLITTEAGYHVILKTETGEKKSYEESVDSMKERILEKKLNAEDANSLMIEAIKHYRDKYNLDIVDSEIDSQYGIYMNNLINSSKSSSN